MLNEYFSAMTEIVFKNEGTIDKFIGDSLMAIFGAPLFNPQSAQNAVRAGLEMIEKLEELQKIWKVEGKPSFKIRVGINTGEVVAGNIGSPERMEYTVIGDSVNLASRLQSIAKPMTVLISDSTYAKVKEIVTANQMEAISVKGKSESVQTYEITDIRITKDDKQENKRRFIRKRVSIFATFKVPPSSRTNQCIIQDISCGGLIMNTRLEVHVGEHIQLDFTLPENDVSFNNTSGKIVFVRPAKDKNSQPFFKTGIEFEDLNDIDYKNIYKFTQIEDKNESAQNPVLT